MRKCPRCDHEVDEQDRFCPHCGFDLQRRYVNMNKRKPNFILYLLILLAFSFMPLLYSFIFDGFTSVTSLGNTIQKQDSQQQLPDVQKASPTAVLAQYVTLSEFNNQYTNVSQYVKSIETYEKELSDKGQYTFDKDYIIQVYDNYNVAFQMTYTTSISEQYDLKIVKMFDRQKTVDKEEITFVKKNCQTFDELILTDDEKALVNAYINDESALNSVIKDFSLRKEEFNQKKDKLGHYGMGTYHDDISYVVERYDQEYRVQLKYSK